MRPLLGTALRGRRILLLFAVVIIAGAVLGRYGRSLWHPVLVKFTGGVTQAEVIARISAEQTDLLPLVGPLTIVVFKDPGVVELYQEGRLLETYPMTATSGGPGPKLRAGDRQVPEGIYGIAAMNPNSSFHLSLKISYPNAEDLARSRAAQIDDPGGDIYLHGKAASIGCVAIGDHAIERLFWYVDRVGMDQATVVIAPCRDPRLLPTPEHRDLYRRLGAALDQIHREGPLPARP